MAIAAAWSSVPAAVILGSLPVLFLWFVSQLQVGMEGEVTSCSFVLFCSFGGEGCGS